MPIKITIQLFKRPLCFPGWTVFMFYERNVTNLNTFNDIKLMVLYIIVQIGNNTMK